MPKLVTLELHRGPSPPPGVLRRSPPPTQEMKVICELKLRHPPITPQGQLDWHDRVNAYADLITEQRPGEITVLEIGVFRGHLTERLFQRLGPKITRYVGVDPYIGDETDPYFSGYWQKQKSVAESAFEQTAALFNRVGGTLLRRKSSEYWAEASEHFDVVIIDGDHREEPALIDLRTGWGRVKPDGLLLCDDYANPDHPGVTRAGNRFDDEVTPKSRGCVFTFFQSPPRRKLIYPLGVAWWKK